MSNLLHKEPDQLQQAGGLGLGSRLKRVSDLLYTQVQTIYDQEGVTFDSKLFPILFALTTKEEQGIVELARALGVTHAHVSALVKTMKQMKLVTIQGDSEDTRRKKVSLTSHGREMTTKLQPIWSKIKGVVENLIKQEAPALLSDLERVERSLQQAPIQERIKYLQQGTAADAEVEIIDWDTAYAAAFRDLNAEWIRKFFVLEDEDFKILNNPQQEILNRGGMIFFVRTNGVIAGTCGVVPRGKKTFELTKMAVSPVFRGKGFGKKLIKRAFKFAKDAGAKKIYLESSSHLTEAINLYLAQGFQKIKNFESKYQRADIAMERGL